MTDDISKVPPVCYCHGTDICIPCRRRYAERQKERLESATTPAEVDKVSELILSEYFADKRNGVGDYWTRDMAKEAHEKIVATLARQLAEAKAVLVSLLTEREHRTDGDLVTLADRCRHLSRGDRDVIQMRGSLIETYKTRALPAESPLILNKLKAKDAAIDARLASDSEGGSDA